ncbi:MAG: hypothetical protein ACKVQQ_04400 [Burkholderiales bacterium]
MLAMTLLAPAGQPVHGQPPDPAPALERAERGSAPRPLLPANPFSSGAFHERVRVLALAEAALASGAAAEARDHFERATAILHALDAEMGMVRALMQSGEYRRALALAAHASGAHPELGAGAALYAWLLHLGGQGSIARDILEGAAARPNADPWVSATRNLMRHTGSAVPPILLRPPARFAPYSPADDGQPRRRISAGLRVGANTVLAPAAGLEYSTGVTLRDQAGNLMRAHVERIAAGTGIALLRAPESENCAVPRVVPTRAHPGSPALSVGFDAGPDLRWPRLALGFLGRPAGLPPYPAAPASGLLPGAGVWNQAGALVGFAVAGAGPAPLLVPADVLLSLGIALPTAEVPAGPRALDEIYEAAWRCTVEVLVTG